MRRCGSRVSAAATHIGSAPAASSTAGVIVGVVESLTLPRRTVEALDLPRRGRQRGILADGGEALFDVHEAVAEGAPLIGMALLEGYELTIEATEGGRVGIKPLSA